MSWVTIIWAMIASACLTLALVHVLVWWLRREALANLLFALAAVATAVFALCELWMMRAETPGAYGTAVRWAHVPIWLVLVSLTGFVWFYLRAGRAWLAWSFVGLRTLSLVLDFLTGQNLNYLEITAVRRIPFLGESASVAMGVPNPWMIIGQLSSLALILFVADASVTVWRRGDRRKALLVGGSIVFFVLAGQTQSMLVFWGIVQAPIMVSLFYLGIVAAMGYELSQDVLRAARLSDDLRESQQRMALATHAANLGIWVRDLVRNEIWATDKWRELLGFAKPERIDLNGFLQKLHPEDREAVSQTFAKALGGEGGYEMEYRVLLPDGRMRWIASRVRIEFDAAGKPVLHEMAIEFADRSVPRAVPEDTALCLYRIAQEALHNVVKHSGGTVARVELAMEGSELRLAIADDGVGFDPKTMRANGSLGLVSMGERARFVHGLLSVESHAGKGTTVEVRVPIAAAR